MGEFYTRIQEKAHLRVASGVQYSDTRASPPPGGIRKPTSGWQVEFNTLMQVKAHLRVASGVQYSDTRASPPPGGKWSSILWFKGKPTYGWHTEAHLWVA